MRTPARATAVAIITVTLITGCERTTTGTVAQTTQPGPPLTTATRTPSAAPPSRPSLPGIPIPIPGQNTDIPEVPAPPNAQTMKCEEYTDLDEATRFAVVRAILAEEGSLLGPGSERLSMIMADGLCRWSPDAMVSEMLLTG